MYGFAYTKLLFKAKNTSKNTKITLIELPMVKEIDDDFMVFNDNLYSIKLPMVEKIKNYFW